MRSLIVLVALGVAACTMWPGDAEQEAVQYCHMVHLAGWPDYEHYLRTDEGWPDYNHVYAQQCKRDGTVNWSYVYGR